MPLIAPGVYIDNGEKAYEVEVCYYLNFYIESALISIKKIRELESNDIALFGNKYQYYHYYTDHVLFAMGQINNRFKSTKNDSNSLRERKQANRKNFKFAEEQYPILSDKNGRNTIEHIDEYNQMTIDALNGVGGFNVIGLETDDELIQCLRTNRSTHPYTLDLVGERILIFRKGAEIDISVLELERELNSLKKNVEDLQNMITI